MSKPFDYSKWDNIDISDDESDCHPNIEKETWFRIKRRNREEREAKEESEKADLTKRAEECKKRKAELEGRLRALDQALAEEGSELEGEDPVALQAEMEEMEASIKSAEDRVAEMERRKKWNWQNMSHVVEERTVISAEGSSAAKDTMKRSPLPPQLAEALGSEPSPGPKTPAQELQSYGDFVSAHEDIMEQYSTLQSMEETKTFLLEHGQILFADHCQSYLLLSCLEDEMNGKHERMELVGRQSQILSNITELATNFKAPPQDVVTPFFRRLEEKQHKTAFKESVQDFIKKVKKRAVDKRKEMQEEEEYEEVELSREERLGPGGLDPVEVFDTLPENLQEAFKTKDTQALVAALEGLTQEERMHHMKRCEDSGLWVPGGKSAEDADADGDETERVVE